MGIKKYIERKQAQKEFGKGWFDNTKSNYNYHVKSFVRTFSTQFNQNTYQNKEYVRELMERGRQAKSDVETAFIGKYLSLGLGGLCLSSINEENFAVNATLLGAFGVASGIMQYMQIKSNREAKQCKDKIKEAFGVDELSNGVYSRTTSEKSGRRMLPVGVYISDKTCHTCIDDAVDKIIDEGFQK